MLHLFEHTGYSLFALLYFFCFEKNNPQHPFNLTRFVCINRHRLLLQIPIRYGKINCLNIGEKHDVIDSRAGA